jgi:ADP-heptose:LPS heptosyltransferase
MHKIKLGSFLLLDFLYLFMVKMTTGRRPLHPRKKILIPRCDAIGDFFMWLPYARALRDAYPPDEYEISLLGNHVWIDAAKKLVDFDHFIPFDSKLFLNNFKYHHKVLKEVYFKAYDVVLQPRLSREFLVEDMLTLFSHAQFSIAFMTTPGSINPVLMQWSDKWYTDLIPFRRKSSGNTVIGTPLLDSEFAANEQFLAALNVKSNSQNTRIQLNDARKRLLNPADRNYFVVISGSSWINKCWDIDKTAETIRRIVKKYHIKAVICGTPDTNERADYIKRSLDSEKVLNLNGQTSLLEFIDLITHAQFVFANDTGGIHIAAAAGVKAFCPTGGGHYGRFLPYPKFVSHIYEMPVVIDQPRTCYGCNWQCSYLDNPRSSYPCISSIEVDDVFDEIDTYISTQCDFMENWNESGKTKH